MCSDGCGKFKKRKLSESTDGRGIKVTSAAHPGIRVHTATTSVATNEWDEVWLKAVNTSTSAVKLTVMWGSTSSDDYIEITIPPETGVTEVIPGLVLQNGRDVRAFADTADVLVLHGFVNRFEQTP